MRPEGRDPWVAKLQAFRRRRSLRGSQSGLFEKAGYGLSGIEIPKCIEKTSGTVDRKVTACRIFELGSGFLSARRCMPASAGMRHRPAFDHPAIGQTQYDLVERRKRRHADFRIEYAGRAADQRLNIGPPAEPLLTPPPAACPPHKRAGSPA